MMSGNSTVQNLTLINRIFEIKNYHDYL